MACYLPFIDNRESVQPIIVPAWFPIAWACLKRYTWFPFGFFKVYPRRLLNCLNWGINFSCLYLSYRNYYLTKISLIFNILFKAFENLTKLINESVWHTTHIEFSFLWIIILLLNTLSWELSNGIQFFL